MWLYVLHAFIFPCNIKLALETKRKENQNFKETELIPFDDAIARFNSVNSKVFGIRLPNDNVVYYVYVKERIFSYAYA